MERAVAEPGPGPSSAPLVTRELTLRALLFGCALGVVLASGNVYTGLKTGFIDGGSITAALLGFAFFSTLRGLGGGPFGKLENNVSQTTASSAAIMGFAIGLPGAVPALQLLGHTYPGWALVAWGLGLGGVGIFVGVVLRRKLVVSESLPFPTGAATAEVIETISTSRSTAMFRARMLVAAAVVAMLVTWFRDGKPSPIPQWTAFGGAVMGVSLASLSVGVSWSPLLVSTGVLMGFRSAFSMLLGGFVFWVCIAPWLVRSHIVPGPGFSQDLPWVTWPAVGLLLSSSFVPLVMEWRGLLRSFRDIPLLLRRREAADDGAGADRFKHVKPLLLVSVVLMLVVARVAFHLPLLAIAFGLLIALVLANVCARTAGETDMAPTGVLGTFTQLAFGGTGFVTSLFAGSITAGVASQTAQTLWAFRAGNQLRASPRAQVWAEILGAVLGALVSVPVYIVIVKAYGIGTVAMPSPSAVSWRATAQAVVGGFSSMPKYAGVGGLVGFGVGVVLSALARGRWGRFVPSAAAMGMAALSPFSLSFSVCLGGIVLLVYSRLRPSAESGHTLMSLVAGGIAGESVMGIIVAILIATGLL
ncbi:MAG TPA: OPT family oligopeptide transporter [Polyangia bacterium]|nr:OPT family oligopeptide transporter [Polyangia bacterium]